MKNALIISNNDKYISYFGFLLNSININNITSKNNAKNARELLKENSFDLIIVDSPLPDEFGKNFSIEIKEKTFSEVIFIIDEESFSPIKEELFKKNIHVISKPFKRKLLVEKLETIYISSVSIKNLYKENKILSDKIEEIKKIDRAKCLLISYLGMNEKQAHKYIEKQAMDFRTTKLEIAAKVLKTYEG